MKRSRNYEVNFLSKTVTVSRKFMDAATQINSDEFDLLTQFSDMGIRVLVEGRKRRSKPKDDKLPLLTYKMMQDYIAMLDDAEDMQKEFESIRESAKSRKDRTQYVNTWFRATFPRYDEVPEFDEDYRIVHNPNPSA
ncbi:MAG: hypothetical protein IJB28_04895 [Bacteroidaceae bacterium]|nr:hypothetical protein [Bacteroidaceae bacterium]